MTQQMKLDLPLAGITGLAWRILKADGSLVATEQSNRIYAEFNEAGIYRIEVTFMDNLEIEVYMLDVKENEMVIYPPDDLTGEIEGVRL